MSKQALAILVAALVFAGGALAQPMPTDPSAAANVRQSQRYEQVLHSNPSFAKKRMQEECGPITDPQLHAQCIASFGQSGR
jgi:hypothetical protein